MRTLRYPNMLLLVIVMASSIAAASAGGPVIAVGQDNDEKSSKKKKKGQGERERDEEGKNEKNVRTVLWTERDIEALDLFNGPGGPEGAPNSTDKFTFVRRSTSGTSEKIIVDDSRGRSWVVKFGPEARPETAAARLVWAAGYHADQDYFVKETYVEGRGGFEICDVRFERRDDGFKELSEWSWTANPFMGTRELEGLKVVMALINNWDIKDENNKVIRPNKESGGDRSMHVYYVSDLGATFGSTGNALRKIPLLSNAPAGSKGVPDSYANQPFIDGVHNGTVRFHYKGKSPEVLQGVTVESARWMGGILGRVSDKQLSDAFRASGFGDVEVAIYVRAVRDRINQLKALR